MNVTDVIERLKSCPNCAGILGDDGRCKMCGSKVYDLVGLDIDHPTPCYLRLRAGGRIMHMPIRCSSLDMNFSIESLPTVDVHLVILGDIIAETEE